MASFLETQLDYIFFFYGLAFILLGILCFVMARESSGKAADLSMLGTFGLVHGASEWLDLTALIVGSTPEFAIFRTSVMAISFVFLMEFARRGGIRLGIKLPGPWIYVPLLLLIGAGGVFGGLVSANVLSRYLLGFVGALGAGCVIIARRRHDPAHTPRMATFAGIGLALYAVAAGVVVPAAPFWPANVLNQDWFVHLTGVPIQLIRGLIACVIAVLVWAVWGQLLVLAVDSKRYTDYLHRQFVGTLLAMAAIFVFGWALTNFLGGIYQNSVQDEARGDINLLASRLAGETATVEAMARALAGSPSVLPMLTGGEAQHDDHGQFVLNLDVEAAGASLGYIVDRTGAVIASSAAREFALLGAPNQSSSPWFRASIGGKPGHDFALDPLSGERIYHASYPVRTADGAIVGVVLLAKSLEGLEAGLLQFDRAFFFIDSDGIVMLTNRRDVVGRSLWPSPHSKPLLSEQFGSPAVPPLLDAEVKAAGWMKFDGKRAFVLRNPVGEGQWSLLITIPISGIFASRFLGIVITLQLAITALFYFFGREHGIRDSVELERRRELQDQTRDLRVQATTDVLTGIYNRLKFNQELMQAMARSRRSHAPFSLVLYDVDHFKEVNDVHGHQTGDQVLVQLSRTVAACLRQTDVLARWGGEEFVILLADSDVSSAFLVAEKLREAIAHATFEQVGTISCSFGVAECSDLDTAETLVARADNALYRAKMNGRNRVELDMSLLEAPALSPTGC